LSSQLGSSGGENFIQNQILTFTNANNYTTGLTFNLRNGASGSEGMRLTSTGLGIGTTSPATQFVVSNAGAQGVEITGSTGSLQVYNRSTAAYGTMNLYANTLYVRTGSSPAINLTVDVSGNTGLGNSSPPTGVRLTSTAPSASGYNLFLEQNNGLDGYLLACTSNDGDLVFSRRDTSGTNTVERARLSSAGFLLVGTTVNTNSYYAVVLNDIAIRTATDASGSTNLRLGVSSSMPQGIATLNGTKTAVGGGDMIFNTATGGVLAEKMRLTGAGLVGIGTTSPNQALSVCGSISLGVGTTAGALTMKNADSQSAATDARLLIGNNSNTYAALRIVFNSTTEVAMDTVTWGNTGTQTNLLLNVNGGKVGMGVGSINASGGVLQLSAGITFPATQSTSSNVNTLDDYEEGTFTANLSNAGYTGSWGTTLARYVKIGKVVNCWVSFDGGTSGAGTGNLTISGLPFAPESFGNWWSIGSWNGSGTTYPQGSVIANGTSTTVAVWNGGGYVIEIKTFLTACISYTTST
jgi:hypothetical protein